MAVASVNYGLNKSAWGLGPWQDEPDEMEWTDKSTGFLCLVSRHPDDGNFRGYVRLPSHHPAQGIKYSDAFFLKLKGVEITFSAERERGDWWVGFHCAHAFDFAPGHESRRTRNRTPPGKIYRDINYVRAQVASLAKQLSEMEVAG